MERREPPHTEEGWYVLHDLRRIDWDAWRAAPERERDVAVAEGVDYLRAHEDLEDAPAGGSAVFSVLGHGADLLLVHMRPSTADLDLAERRFERTALAEFTERTDSYVSVTEVSGYTTDALRDGSIEDVEDEGLRAYLEGRLYPEIPDAGHVCFYPMSKRRGPGDNWYDLPFEERAEHMSSHGDIGRGYAGKVNQIISGSVGFDDHEWGVTLFADDPTDIKHLLYEMRFDPSTSRFAEFGPFYFGRRFPPEDLGALLAGEAVPADEGATPDPEPGVPEAHATRADGADGAETPPGAAEDDSERAAAAPGMDRSEGDPPHEEVDRETLERQLHGLGIDPGDHPGAGYGLVFRSSTDAEELVDDVDGLRGNFDHYDTHVLTTVRAGAGESAVVSLWRNERAATTASGFLGDLPGVDPGVGGSLGESRPDDGGAEREGPEDGEAATGADTDAGGADDAAEAATGAEDIREELESQGIYAGQPHGEDVYALVLYSEADPGTVADRVGEMRDRFDHYDTHVQTAVYEPIDGGRAAVASIWATADAAETAAGYLSDLPGVVGRAGGAEGFGTMGMFYTVEPEHREDFVDRFAAVGDLLGEMDGHRETTLLANREDENEMFIASRWRSKDDAMEFFRSDEFRETVDWGREVLADRPRHVFLT